MFPWFISNIFYFLSNASTISEHSILIDAEVITNRASPCEFVIPLAKYVKAVYHTRISVGMRFRMLFETEESSVRRYVFKVSSSLFIHSQLMSFSKISILLHVIKFL